MLCQAVSDLMREYGCDLIVGKGIEDSPIYEDKVPRGGHRVEGSVINDRSCPVSGRGGGVEELLKDRGDPFLSGFVSQDRTLREHLCVELVPGLNVAQVGGGGVGDLSGTKPYPWAAADEENQEEEVKKSHTSFCGGMGQLS